MKMERRDFVILLLIVFVWAITIRESYKTGVDNGYWEHEAEENSYVCQAFNG